MAIKEIKETTKHEMSYDTTTGQAIFNGRNKTAKSPIHKSFPERLVTIISEDEGEE